MVAPRLGLYARLGALCIALATGAMLAMGAYLKPSPDGLGTHTELGLNSCEWLEATHFPCPTCGMTTSTSWFVRGDWEASFYVQPMGFLIALLATITFWASLYIAITGRPSYRLLRRMPAQKMLFAFLLFGALAWGWKIFIHLHGIDGWRR